MKDREVCIATQALAAGARLAKPVSRANGAVLLHAGAVNDADQLRLLIQRGIDSVYVLQEDLRDEEETHRDVGNALGRVAHLFRGEGSAARQALAETIADYRRQSVS
ncbi:MAG: hypothetical protein K9J74_09735 [Sulfuritalea sp.]|nr:hypothetical protein [Sulfuritalea sp.]